MEVRSMIWRSRQAVLSVAAVVVVCAALPTSAQVNPAAVSVRLIVADNSTERTQAAGAEDVLPGLQKTYRFASYRLLAKKSLRITPGAKVALPEGFIIRVSRLVGDAFYADIQSRGKVFMRPRLKLVPGQPISFGGFPAGKGGSYIIVFSVP
jgi:hypothetical protein